MLITSFLVSCTVLALASGQSEDQGYRPQYPYGGGLCSRLPSSHTCCVGRRDDCSTPISNTKCYCDSFCNQHGPNRDCCSDYESFCGVTPTPGYVPESICPYGGINYDRGSRVRLRDSCYYCTCKQITPGKVDLQCDYVCTNPGGGCRYNGMTYQEGRLVTIEDRCYSCTCQRSWHNKITMNCVYTCPRPPITPIIDVIDKCYYQNRFWYLGETVEKDCKICTCKKKSSTDFSVECVDDIKCLDHVCSYKNYNFGLRETVRVDCEICTCERKSTGYGAECRPDPDCRTGCHYNSQFFPVGFRIRKGLQECTCTTATGTTPQFHCTDPPRPERDTIDMINIGNYGWKAYKYSFLTGYTMEEVFRMRTGVCRPETQVISDPLFSESPALSIYPETFQRDTFDARTQWPGMVRPISNAGNHPISWALTTAELAADRLAVKTGGRQNVPLSTQNIISCVRQANSQCSSTMKGWEYINRYGIVSEECYPLTYYGTNSCKVNMGETFQVSTCPSGRGNRTLVRPPHQRRISTTEWNIRSEIGYNGPVQAHIRVKEDFFYYRSGVYRHVYGNLVNNKDYYLAVRIIGWGTEIAGGSQVKYWICANTWGTSWGENGYFRIVRGTNECQIEEYVYAV